MKSKIYAMMVMAVALFMTACSNEDEPTPNLVQDLAGTYKGYTVADFKYTTIPMTTADESVSLTANTDGTGNVSFTSGQWGTFTVSNAVIALKNDTYTIEGSGKTVMGMDPASQKEYDCTLEGNISKDKQTVSILFNVPSVMGGLEVTFTLGDAPASMVIAGVYEGTLEQSVSGSVTGTDDNSKVTIKSQENGKAEITLAGFGSGAMAFSDVVVADVEVASQADKSYQVTGTINTTSGSFNVTGSLEGTIKDGKANIVFTMKPGAMPMNIVATFASK